MSILENLFRKYSGAGSSPVQPYVNNGETTPLDEFVQTSVNNPDNKTQQQRDGTLGTSAPQQAASTTDAPVQGMPQLNTGEMSAGNTQQNTPATGQPIQQLLSDPEFAKTLSEGDTPSAEVRATQTFASGYKPESGGFLTQLYEQLHQKPQEVDEKTLEKRRKQAALTDALSLLAQTGLAFAGGNVRERKFDEMASGKTAAYAKELHDIYRQDSEKYQTGLMNAAVKDYEVGYKNWADNRNIIMKLLEDARKNRAAKEEAADKRLHEEKMINLRQEGSEKLTNINNTARASEGKADRESRERIARAQNAVNWENTRIRNQELDLQTRKYTDELKGAGVSTKGMKPVIFRVDGAQKGASSDGVGYYKNRVFTLAQYQSLLQGAKKEIDAGDKLYGYPVRKMLKIPDDAKLSDDDYIRYYATLHPQILAEDFSLDELGGTVTQPADSGNGGENKNGMEEKNEFEDYKRNRKPWQTN
jgi:hypothetical protein